MRAETPRAEAIMTYRGRVHNNVVALPPDAMLPEGCEVIVEPVGTSAEGGSLLDHLGDLVGSIEGLPEDFAENHDHYIHGVPKR